MTRSHLFFWTSRGHVWVSPTIQTLFSEYKLVFETAMDNRTAGIKFAIESPDHISLSLSKCCKILVFLLSRCTQYWIFYSLLNIMLFLHQRSRFPYALDFRRYSEAV